MMSTRSWVLLGIEQHFGVEKVPRIELSGGYGVLYGVRRRWFSRGGWFSTTAFSLLVLSLSVEPRCWRWSLRELVCMFNVEPLFELPK